MSGYLFAMGSAVFNGSFVAFMKIPSVAKADLHPVLFNAYCSFGVFLSSWLVVPFFGLTDAEFGFTWFGFLAGGLFVFAGSFSFIAASAIGLSTGQGVWGGVAIVVSFLWGTLGPAPISAPVQSLALSLLAILLLLAGVVGIVKCEAIGAILSSALARRPSRTSTLLAVGPLDAPLNSSTSSSEGGDVAPASARLHDSMALAGEESATGDGKPSNTSAAAAAAAASASKRVGGLAAAVTVGVFGGSILAPASFAGDEFTGSKALAFLPSFGIGALCVAAVTTAAWYAVVASRGAAPPLQLRGTLWAGTLSGATWNAGNLCSIVAINFCDVPFGVAYPILQVRRTQPSPARARTSPSTTSPSTTSPHEVAGTHPVRAPHTRARRPPFTLALPSPRHTAHRRRSSSAACSASSSSESSPSAAPSSPSSPRLLSSSEAPCSSASTDPPPPPPTHPRRWRRRCHPHRLDGRPTRISPHV